MAEVFPVKHQLKIQIAALAIIIFCCSCSESRKVQESVLSGVTMGTSYNITVIDDATGKVAPEEISSVLDNIENIMSTYKPDSELMLLNQKRDNSWVRVSESLFEVLSISQEISIFTGGAFDISISPLVNLWGFGSEVKDMESVPDSFEISELMKTIGYQNLTLADDRSAVMKTRAIQLDLSGVAKGYAVDQVANLLEENGITNYLVEIGGEVQTHGLNANGEKWRIGIEVPEFNDKTSQRIIKVDNKSMASSGDYRNYFEEDGLRYSHIIDPRSGWSISHKLASATVIAESTARADALATAFMVLGAEQALTLANENDIPAFFLIKTDDGFTEKYSVSFAKFLND